MALFRTPVMDLEDDRVLEEIRQMRAALAETLRAPRRWNGNLRRNAQARAIQGSNSIEGYVIDGQDAVAAVDDEEPLSADELTWAEIKGYRRLLTWVVGTASADAAFELSALAVRMMHFMLLEHDVTKSPGQYRPGEIYIQDERTGEQVYQGPPAEDVPALVEAFVASVTQDPSVDPMVSAAMAHLNLVMIHPFRDGNGRMARAVQTLVLAKDQVLEPTFSSIEEWLGANTEDYYRVLAHTGAGGWHPERDAHLWVKFALRAHHMQAQTLQRRFVVASQLWQALDELIVTYQLPERVLDPLFDAALGLRVRRSTHVKRAQIEERTATRDLGHLVSLGLLEAQGQTRGRYYRAGPGLAPARAILLQRRDPLSDPYPWLTDTLRSTTPVSDQSQTAQQTYGPAGR